MIRLLKSERRGVGTVRYFFQLLAPLLPHAVSPALCVVGIDRLAVGSDDRSHIVHALHAALDLEGRSAALDELGDVIDHAEVFAVENVCPVVILFDGPVLSGAGLFHDRILEAAGLDTFAAVRLALAMREEIRKPGSGRDQEMHIAPWPKTSSSISTFLRMSAISFTDTSRASTTRSPPSPSRP